MSEDLQEKRAKKYNAKLQDFKRFFTTESGKRVLYDLVSNHFMMQPTMGAKPDPLEMAYNEGQRQVVLRIMTILKAKPVDITALIEEAHSNAVASI